MKIRYLFLVVFATVVCSSGAQTKSQQGHTTLLRPKLVVGIVVDQMRWDFLYRYYDRYETGGFKRLLNEGFSCENTDIYYVHVCVCVIATFTHFLQIRWAAY